MAALAALPAPAVGQDVGVLVMAHGGSAEWNESVGAALEPLRDEVPVALAFGMADRATLAAGLDSLRDRGVQRVALVRMFLSGESFRDQTDYLLGFSPEPPAMYMHHGPDGHVMIPTRGLPRAEEGSSDRDDPEASHDGTATSHGGAHAEPGDSGENAHDGASDHGGAHSVGGASEHGGAPMSLPLPIDARGLTIATHDEGLKDWARVGRILEERVLALSGSPEKERVLVIAHGMGDEAENQAVLDDLARASAGLAELGFGDVRPETLREDWAEARAEAEARIRGYMREAEEAGDAVIVVPFRLSGFGPYAKVLDGFEYRAADGLLPHPTLTDWVRERAAGIARAQGWGVLAEW